MKSVWENVDGGAGKMGLDNGWVGGDGEEKGKRGSPA